MKTIRLTGVCLAVSILLIGLVGCGKQNESQVSSAPPEENPATAAEPMPEMSAPPASQTTETAEAPTPVHVTTPVKSAKPASSKHHSTSKSVAAVPASETRTISLPTGATFDVELQTAIDTGKNNVGDPVEGKLVQALNAPDGSEIAVQGAVIHGEISELKRASKSRDEDDRASVKVAFTSIQTVDGEKTLSATVTNVQAMKAGSTTKRDALVIGGSAVAGAVLGKVIGGDTKGAAIGALGGAVVGTGAVMASKGHELEIPVGSKISLRSEQPITVAQK